MESAFTKTKAAMLIIAIKTVIENDNYCPMWICTLLTIPRDASPNRLPWRTALCTPWTSNYHASTWWLAPTGLWSLCSRILLILGRLPALAGRADRCRRETLVAHTEEHITTSRVWIVKQQNRVLRTDLWRACNWRQLAGVQATVLL